MREEVVTTEVNPEWIGLSLSGGGFRATLFHLGVIRLLRDWNLLEKVRVICAVSGGSILAAHLVLNWEKYISKSDDEFREAERSLIEFAKTDIRDRIFRRGLAARLFVAGFFMRRFELTSFLQQNYDALYENAKFAALNAGENRPDICILASSLTTGSICKFTSHNFEIVDNAVVTKSIRINLLPISLAVAASSAVPPVFEAVRIDHKILQCNFKEFEQTHWLTDGGIRDVTGLQELVRLTPTVANVRTLLIASDASANFDWKPSKWYPRRPSRVSEAWRSNEIAMQAIRNLVKDRAKQIGAQLCQIDIGHTADAKEQLLALPREVQTRAQNIRTDLNAFSQNEIDVLTTHGYLNAMSALQKIDFAEVRRTDPQNTIREEIWGRNPRTLRLEKYKHHFMRRLFAIGDPATRIILAWVLFWLGFYLFLHYWNRPGTVQPQEFSQVPPNGATSLLTRHYAVKVTDFPGHPIANAKVILQIGDSTVEGSTGPGGIFPFTWRSSTETITAQVHVKASGYSSMSQDLSLVEDSVGKVSLNKED